MKKTQKRNQAQIKKAFVKKSKASRKDSMTFQTELKADQKLNLHLDKQVWPIERDIFFRPARLKYVRKIIQPSGCVFCHSAEKPQSVKTLCVVKTKYSQVVINKFPYNSGHVLVLPLRHTGNIFDLSDAEFTDVNLLIRKTMQALTDIYQPQGFNVGLNHGATAGAGIPGHLHWHIVPRWNGDLNFFPLIAETKLVIEDVTETYKKLVKYFKK